MYRQFLVPYYKFFKITEKYLTPYGLGMPEWLTILWMLFLILFNYLAINLILKINYGFEIVRPNYSFPILSIVFVIHYLIFIRKKRYKIEEIKFDNKSIKYRRIINITSLIYTVLSISILIYTTIIY